MPRKMFPLEVLQHYVDDLNSFSNDGYHYFVLVDSKYYYLQKISSKSQNFGINVYRSSDYETFCNKVSLIARKQVREYMKDIVYPYKRKVGHATRS